MTHTSDDLRKPQFRFFTISRYGYQTISPACSKLPVSLDFAALSQKQKLKFKTAGIRPAELQRSNEDAERLFFKIPRHARTSEDNIVAFLTTKDASHIKSHGKEIVPKQEGFNELNSADNLVWETSRVNRRRGARLMTSREIEQANMSNTAEANLFLLTDALKLGARAAIACALLELPQADNLP